MSIIRKQKNKGAFQGNNIHVILSNLKKNGSKWMSCQTEKLSPTQGLMILGLFCLLTSSYNSYLISRSILSKGKKGFSITSIDIPITEMLDGKNREDYLSTEGEYQQVNSFRQYLDSLKKSPLGKVKYNRVIHQYPGLMGSLDVIEHHDQSKKN